MSLFTLMVKMLLIQQGPVHTLKHSQNQVFIISGHKDSVRMIKILQIVFNMIPVLSKFERRNKKLWSNSKMILRMRSTSVNLEKESGYNGAVIRKHRPTNQWPSDKLAQWNQPIKKRVNQPMTKRWIRWWQPIKMNLQQQAVYLTYFVSRAFMKCMTRHPLITRNVW